MIWSAVGRVLRHIRVKCPRVGEAMSYADTYMSLKNWGKTILTYIDNLYIYINTIIEYTD